MPTEWAERPATAIPVDHGWPRLGAALAAAGVWLIILVAVGHVLKHAATPPSESSLDVQVIELPVPTPRPVVAKPPESPRRASRQEPPRTAPAQRMAASQRHVAAAPAQVASSIPQTNEAGPPADAPSVPVSDAGNAPEPATRPDLPTGPPGGGSMGAQAIYRPLPPFPETLRQESLHMTAVALFQIAADGTARVDLSTPTPSPQLNRFLLSVLRTWRFSPALADGNPVASTLAIRLPIDID